jgi:D-galactarolactone isomerase
MTLHNGTLGFDVMDQLMKEVHPFGWHANIQLDGRELPKYEAQIKRLPGKFVIDHTGKFSSRCTTFERSSAMRAVDTGAAGSSSRHRMRPRRPARRSTRTWAGSPRRW